MRRFTNVLIILFFAVQLEVFPSGNDYSKYKTVKAIKLTDKFEFDGRLAEPFYTIQPVKEFIQRDPNEGEPATEKTNVWITYDENHLYVSAKMYDSSPESIDASLMRRDNMIESDWFFVYLDPYLDKRTGYYFAVNPGGSLLDGTLFNDSWDDDSWDGIWEAKTNIDKEGWTMEMRIPFTQLRFNEAEEMKWGVNFNRDIKRKKEMDYFVMIPKQESGFVSRFATLEGLNGIKSAQRFEILPYVVQKAQYLVHDSGDPFYKSNQYKTAVGADFKMSIGSNLNLDATVNPDFGQVEVDPAVVNLSAFETYYQEKRPFFIEGSNVFTFGNIGVNNNWGFNFGDPTLTYSRRIGRYPQGEISDYDYGDIPAETRILGAAKLTGKVSETWSLGALSAVTERTFATLKYNGNKFTEQVEPLTHYGILRARKELNEGKHSYGMMFTSVNRDLNSKLSEILVDEAYTFGVDGFTTLDEEGTYVLKAYAIGSYVSGTREAIQNKQEQPYRYMQRPDATFSRYDPTRTSLSGLYSRVMLNKQKGNFYLNTAVGIVTPGFENNDFGFQYRADVINAHMVAGYRFYEPNNLFRKSWHYVAHFRSYDFEGNNTTNGLMIFNGVQFLNYFNLDMQASYNFDQMSNRITRGGPLAKDPSEFWMGADFSTDGREKIVGELEGDFWKDRTGGYGYEIGFGLDWKPNTQLNININPSYSGNKMKRQWVDYFDDPFAVNTYGTRYVFAEIDYSTLAGNIRVNWTFTPQLSLQVFLQPLFSVGDYANYKELAQPRSLDYNIYGQSGSTISHDKESNYYTVDPDGGGPADTFEFENPDFNFKSLRGNIVLRYEVLPGSVFYFVWTHNKTSDAYPGSFSLNRDFRKLWSEEADNIFLVKFSYWFNT